MKTVIHSILIFLSITTVLVLTEVRAYTADYFHMDRPKLGMELDFEYEEETREGPFVSRKDQTTDLTERLDIATGGWIYHPALATYSLVISPEWQQLREKNSSGPSSIITTSDSFLQGYDAELVLLPRKPYTLTLFARRQTDSLNNNFSGRTKIEETTYGSHLVLKSGLFPTSISYMHLDSQTSGYYTGDKDRDDLKFTSSNTSKFGSLQLSGSYSSSDETLNESVLDSEQQLYSLLHSRSFLENNEAILRTSLIYTDTKNTNGINRGLSANETLSLRHRKNLRTQYTLRYDKRTLFNELNPTKTVDRTASGHFNLTHLLYENLTTSVNAGAIRFRTTGSEEVRYDSGVAFLYYRNLPVGSIRAEMGQQFNVTKVDNASDFSRVNDESVTLTSTFTFLKQDDIDINSIIVKDSSGFIYPEPGNYVISRTGSLTRIRCIIGGLLDAVLNCSAGAPVLIDYDYRTLYPFDYWTHDQSYGVSLNLVKTLDMYYRFSKSKQYFIKGIRSSTDELYFDKSHRFGVALNMEWSETDLSFENRDSSSLPLERATISEVITLQPTYYSIIRLSTSYTTTKYIKSDETEKLTTIVASYEKVISNHAKLSANGFYNRISSPTQSSVDQGLLVALDWFYRIYSGRITYTYDENKDNIVGEIIKNNALRFVLSRRLF